MKNKKPVLIVLGEPNSVFVELLSKVLNKKTITKKINYPIIIIGSNKLILSQFKIIQKKFNFEILNNKKVNYKKLKNKTYLMDVNYKFKKPFEAISKKSKKYITECFKNGLKFLNHGLSDILINGPISKKHYLEKKYPGITEFIFDKADKKISQNPVMLIYNKKFSVSPVTTHIPLKNVHKKINEKLIVKNILLIHNFYRKYLHIKPKIAVVGLNPHCESNSKFNEDIKIITPAVRKLKNKNIKISGPFSADTFFLNENVEKYNSVVGMYHDQVLTPFKTIFEFDASNITLGLPFLRMSVDHGPNVKMLGKNKSNTGSLENIFKLINSLK